MIEYVTGIGDGYYWWFEDTESMTIEDALRLQEELKGKDDE